MANRQGESTSVWDAMDRALGAERQAREEIEATREEANRILSEARDREQHIRETTQRRIQRVHESAQRATAARIRKMRREAADKMAVIDYEPGRSGAVARAVANIARRLTSPLREHD
jgi:vacuolar-type H+-ATPase subunit H